MAEISIYGDIVPFKWFNDGSEYDLSDLNTALAALDTSEDKELIVNIHTFGGCTITAFSIYNKLRRFKRENGVNITTRVDGYCASAGVSLLLAGDKRIGNAYAEPFVHNAWTWTWDDLDKKKATKIAEDLTRTDNQIATLYADRTTITVEQALAFMDADTWLSAEQCLEFGFFTELEADVIVTDKAEVFNSLRALRKSNNSNTDIMKNKKQNLFNALQVAANKFLGTEAKNKIVFTATSEELDFYDLAEDATPVVGDKATFDGKPAGDSNEGVYVLQSGETYTFEGEELKTITPADDSNTDENSVEALQTENAALKAENETLKAAETANKLEIKNLKKDLATSKNLVAQFAAIQLEDEDEDEDPSKETPNPRQNKKGKDGEVSTRNLLANIK